MFIFFKYTLNLNQKISKQPFHRHVIVNPPKTFYKSILAEDISNNAHSIRNERCRSVQRMIL